MKRTRNTGGRGEDHVDTIADAINSVLSQTVGDDVIIDDNNENVSQPAVNVESCLMVIDTLKGKVATLERHVEFLLSFLGVTNNNGDINCDSVPSFQAKSTILGGNNGGNSLSTTNKVKSYSAAITGRCSTDEPDFPLIIHRTLKDASRRKRNVVVTGLPEDPSCNDQDAFLRLCELNLPIKPAVVNGGCTRLGKRTGDTRRSRRLLVRLTSDEAASELLNVAPRLRHSADQRVASHVYISADLSRSEAKLAFEERQRRRDRVAKRMTTPRATTAAVQPYSGSEGITTRLTSTSTSFSAASMLSADAQPFSRTAPLSSDRNMPVDPASSLTALPSLSSACSAPSVAAQATTVTSLVAAPGTVSDVPL